MSLQKITRYSIGYILKEKYGGKIYKIALKGGITCPNRDGSKGTGGCIFCSLGGSGDFASENIDDAIAKVSAKNPDGKYIAYFQDYTPTYQDPAVFEKMLKPVLERDDIVCISVASRPDCLGPEILKVLKYAAGIKPLWVELGLQTSDENTASVINRCYTNDVFEKAVCSLKGIGAEVIVHLIIGLPGETKQHNIRSVRYINSIGVSGVKFQLLHVLRDTPLEQMYDNYEFRTLSLEEYSDIICDCLLELNGNITVHRITGDGPKKILVSPLWSADKKNVLNTLRRNMYERNIILL